VSARDSILALKSRMAESIIGQESMIERRLLGLLANGKSEGAIIRLVQGEEADGGARRVPAPHHPVVRGARRGRPRRSGARQARGESRGRL